MKCPPLSEVVGSGVESLSLYHAQRVYLREEGYVDRFVGEKAYKGRQPKEEEVQREHGGVAVSQEVEEVKEQLDERRRAVGSRG